MTRRRLARKLTLAQAQNMRTLGPLIGARIPLGCDGCDAEQRAERSVGGQWWLVAHHADDCPIVANLEGRPPDDPATTPGRLARVRHFTTRGGQAA
jgi:hypothetical protein